MADRFYCPDPPTSGRLVLGPEESRHLARVRRVALGEIVEVFDGRGQGYRAEVLALGKDRAELGIVANTADRAAPVELTLATAVPKGERFDWLVEKATELGVARLVPLRTERSTVDPRAAKLDRLRRVVVEASKQCGRNRLMDLAEPIAWADLLDRGETAANQLLAHPGGGSILGVDGIAGVPAVLAVGPEGGFTDEELRAARERGWRVVGLGPTILRIETAALAGCAVLLAKATGG
jgi:16S rRNA (uracil1498-N3)-methyltransferase